MSNIFSREDIRDKLRTEVFGEFQDNLIQSVEDKTEKLAEHLKTAQQGIVSGDTDQALRTLIDTLEQQNTKIADDSESENQPNTENAEWIDHLNELTSGLKDQILLPQENERFYGTDSDSLFIGAGKLGKRTLLGIHKLGLSVQATFKKTEPTAPVWNQTIPLKQLTQFHLLDVFPVLEEWSHQLKKVKAEVLLETDAWTLHSSGLIKHSLPEEESSETKAEENERPGFDHIPNQDDIESFFEEALTQLSTIKKAAEKQLSDKLNTIQQQTFHALSVTGTIEKSASDYSTSKVLQKQQKTLQTIQSNEKQWGEVMVSLLNRCHLSMSFMTLYQQSKDRIDGFGNSLEEFFTTNFENPAKQLLQQIEETAELFEDSDDRSTKEIQKLSQQHLKEINEHIEKNLLNPCNELIEDAVLGSKLERFTSAMPEWTKNQQKQAVLVEELDLSVFPPVFELEKVDWQSLVQRVLSNQIAKEFVPKQVKAEEFLSAVQRDIQEIAQIILTNIEIADEVKKSDEEEPLQVAKEGLERARVKLEEVINRVVEKKEELRNTLADKKQVAFSKLAMLLEKQNVNEVRLAGAQYMAKETAVDWKIKFQVYWAKFAEKAELFGRFIWIKLKSYYEIVSKFLGFTKKDNLEGDTTDLATFLSKTDEQIAGLPFIYRRLFDFHKEVEDRFYIRKPDQFDRLKKGYELWQKNFPSSFSIVGEKGSGKSLFIRMLRNEVLTKNDVIEINFPDTIWTQEEVATHIAKSLKIEDATSFEDLIAAIKRKKKRIIVILENVQNCFIRNLSGFEAMEQLLLLISETNKDILWIASSTRYGWLYLDKVLNVVDYFTHAVETDNLSAQQIEELILRRHRASGYQLTFLPDEATKNNRNYKKHLDDEEKSQEYLKDRYFEKLAKISEGNSSVAMIYWIRSIKEYDDTHFYINPFEFGAVNRIQELDSNEMFALAAFILHDSLTAEELSMAIHQSKRESMLLVSRLSSQSILVESEHGFAINQLIYRQIVRALKEANFIH